MMLFESSFFFYWFGFGLILTGFNFFHKNDYDDESAAPLSLQYYNNYKMYVTREEDDVNFLM